MTIKSRQTRLEQHAPRAGEHLPVMDIEGRRDAWVHVYRCACGDPGCRQHPELRIVLNHATLDGEG
jgi:hypothetical protein